MPNQPEPPPFLSKTIEPNLNAIRYWTRYTGGVNLKVLPIGNSTRICAIVSIDGLADRLTVHHFIIQPIQEYEHPLNESAFRKAELALSEIESRMVAVPVINRTNKWEELVPALLSGDTALLVDGSDRALVLKSSNLPGRSVAEPQTESLVRGPREGFTENIFTNLSLIRKQLRDPHLVIESRTVGRRTRQEMAVLYVEGIIHPDIVRELNRRLETLDLDIVPESGTIEQWIEDSFLSPFPQILHTERPDKVSTALLQGKAAILLDGTPFALTLPTTFTSLIQSPEDYYERWMIGSLIRMLRYMAALLSLLLPSLYIALISYHQGMIPFKLAFSIAASREGVPFPAVIEALLMEGTLELLREAGVRLPKPIGQTIGIVGGLVIGEAAVQAGVVSPIMVIIVSVTAISSFAIPNYSAGISFRVLRFIIMLCAGIFGLYGIVLALIVIYVHLARLRSFGVPYLAPITPIFLRDWKDLFIRAPLTMLTKRPAFMQTKDVKRTGNNGGKT